MVRTQMERTTKTEVEKYKIQKLTWFPNWNSDSNFSLSSDNKETPNKKQGVKHGYLEGGWGNVLKYSANQNNLPLKLLLEHIDHHRLMWCNCVKALLAWSTSEPCTEMLCPALWVFCEQTVRRREQKMNRAGEMQSNATEFERWRGDRSRKEDNLRQDASKRKKMQPKWEQESRGGEDRKKNREEIITNR